MFQAVLFIFLKMKTNENAVGSLEGIGYFFNELGILIASGIQKVKNDVHEEIKHGYFHIVGIEHDKIQKGEINPFTYFPEFKYYTRTDFG